MAEQSISGMWKKIFDEQRHQGVNEKIISTINQIVKDNLHEYANEDIRIWINTSRSRKYNDISGIDTSLTRRQVEHIKNNQKRYVDYYRDKHGIDVLIEVIDNIDYVFIIFTFKNPNIKGK